MHPFRRELRRPKTCRRLHVRRTLAIPRARLPAFQRAPILPGVPGRRHRNPRAFRRTQRRPSPNL